MHDTYDLHPSSLIPDDAGEHLVAYLLPKPCFTRPTCSRIHSISVGTRQARPRVRNARSTVISSPAGSFECQRVGTDMMLGTRERGGGIGALTAARGSGSVARQLYVRHLLVNAPTTCGEGFSSPMHWLGAAWALDRHR